MSEFHLSPCKLLFRLVFRIFLSILVALGLPILFLSALPTVFLRYFVILLAKILSPPGLGEILHGISNVFGVNANITTMVFHWRVQGIPDLTRIKEDFTLKILNCRDSHNKLKYPELGQCIVSWCGYLFWKNVPNFELPIRLIPPLSFDLYSNQGRSLLTNMAEVKWDFGRQVLWEIVIIQGQPGFNHFDIIFRYHHALGDGISILKLFNNVTHPDLVEQAVQPNIGRGQSYKWSFISTLVMIPYDLAVYIEAQLNSLLGTDVFSMIDTDRAGFSGRISYAPSRPAINFGMMKKLAKENDISFTTLMYHCLTNSVRKAVLKRGVTPEGDILVNFPMPREDHPDKMRNIVRLGYVVLPISEEESTRRMQLIKKQLDNLGNSAIPWFLPMLGSLATCQLSFILRIMLHLNNRLRPNFTFTNFSWNRLPIKMFGHPVLGMNGILGGTHNTKGEKFMNRI